MATYNPSQSPYGGGNPYTQNPYQRYEQYQGNPLGQYVEMAMGVMGIKTGQPGQLDFGINNQSNLYGNLQYQARTKQHSQAMMRSYENDTGTFIDMVRGGYNLANKGDQFTSQTQQRLLDVHNAFGASAPYMTDPNSLRMYDLAHGGRSQMPLAHYIQSTGEGYMPGLHSDPRQSGQRAADLANSVHQQFYAGGAADNFSRSSGLKSGEMAESIQALANQGAMPDLKGAIDPKTKKWSSKEAGKQFNEALGEWSQVLGTMKEIFVAEGRVNTPMNQLLAAADSLTGGLQQITRKSAVSRIRGLYESANKLGLGSEAVVANLEQSSAVAQQYGLNQAFATPLAQYGFEFKGAISGLQNVQDSWGLKNNNELMLMAQQKQAAFVASEGGNRIGMMQRMAVRKYGDANGKIDASKITGDDATSKAMRALAKGETSNPELAAMLRGNENDFLNQMAGTLGISKDTLALELGITPQNQQAVHKYDLGRFGAGAQRGEFGEEFTSGGGAFGRATDVMVSERVGSGAGAQKLTDRLTKASGEALGRLTDKEVADPVVRKAKQAAAMKAKLLEDVKAGNPEAKKLYDSLVASEGGLERGLQTLGEQQWGTLETSLQQSGQIEGGLQNVYIAANKAANDAAQKANAENTVNAQAKSMGMGRIESGGIADRVSQQILKAGKDKDGKVDTLAAVRAVLGKDVNNVLAKKIADMSTFQTKTAEELAAIDKKIAVEGVGAGEENTNQKQLLTEALEKSQKEMDAELKKSTAASVKAAIGDTAANEKEQADKKPSGKSWLDASGGDGKGGLKIDNLTLVVDGKVLVEGKVAQMSQNDRGKGAT